MFENSGNLLSPSWRILDISEGQFTKRKILSQNIVMKKIFQCAFWRSQSTEYLASYFIGKVHKRLQNISENPNLDYVFKNTLDK
jgi:hypothetical protein